MPPSQVAGFNDYDPKYNCCCHVRTCGIIIGALCVICGGIGLLGSFYRLLKGSPIEDEILGAGALLFMFVAGCLLLVGIFREKSGLLIPFLVFCVVDMFLATVQTGFVITHVAKEFNNKSIRRLNNENRCGAYGLSRCDENSVYYIVVAALIGLLIILLIVGFFFNRVYRARQYLNEKNAARGAGYQMGFVQHQ